MRSEAVGPINASEVFQGRLGPAALGGRLIIVVAKVVGTGSLEDHGLDPLPFVLWSHFLGYKVLDLTKEDVVGHCPFPVLLGPLQEQFVEVFLAGGAFPRTDVNKMFISISDDPFSI